MMSIPAAPSPRSCHSHWPSAVFLAVTAAAVAAALSGCMRAGASEGRAPGVSRLGQTSVRTLVALERTTSDGRTVEVPLAEEYRAIRPAGALPAIPPSETWPAQ